MGTEKSAGPMPSAGFEEPLTWYNGVPDMPDLSGTSTLQLCFEECQSWARLAGFDLVSSGGIVWVKQTFVYKKGRVRKSGTNPTVTAAEQRVGETDNALPRHELCKCK